MQREKEEFINRYKKFQPSDSIVNEEALLQFKPFRSNHFIECGFSNETLDYFEVAGGYTDKNRIIRDIIPIRDANGELAGYSLRDIRHEADYDNKYISTFDFDKDHVLYNLHNVKVYGEEFPLIVVEGFKSVWKMYDCGIYNVVACMGSKITPGQCNLLCTYALRGVITMFDNDVAGIKGTASAYKDLSNKMRVIPIFITEVDEEGKGLDPSDLSREALLKYLTIGD
jgi:DNA primase